MFGLKILLSSLLLLVVPMHSVFATESLDANRAFAWPAPQVLKVAELSFKNGNTAELTYEIHFVRGESNNYRVSLRNLDFTKINEITVTPAIRKQMKPAIEAFKSLPTFVVNQEGRLIHIDGLDRLIDATGRMIEGNQSSGGAEIKEMLKSSPAKKLLLQALSQYWSCWVESWIDFDLPPGAVLEEVIDEQLPYDLSSTRIHGTRTWEHLGNVPGQPNLVHLRLVATYEDGTLSKAIGEAIQNFDRLHGAESDPKLESLPVMLADLTMEVKIDPVTLRPVWAKRSKYIRANSSDPKYAKARRSESHEYTFTWE